MVRLIAPFLFGAILLAGCNTNQRSIADVELYNPSGDLLGTAKLKENPDGVEFDITVEGLEPGYHGIHVHEYPECEPPDFKSAGSHWDPDNKQHGLMHPEGAHKGDLPNIEADGAGKAKATLMLPGATLKDDRYSLYKNGGTSLVIHELQDDGVTQPAGDSGNRVACGKISLTKDEKNPPSDPTEGDKEEEE
ncbi:superoxide dismutase family protein [Bacillaceae bacterium S4-13-58]